MKAAICVIAVIFGLAGATAARIPGNVPVAIHVAVEDLKDLPVAGLGPEAFTVAVDGVRRPVLSATPAVTPLSILLLVDDSRSMQAFDDSLEKAAPKFLAALDAADRIRVGLFGERIVFAPVFSSARASFRLKPRDAIELRQRTPTGGSPLWDAMHQSVELLAAENHRRVLLVFSDGRASGNWYGVEEVAEYTVDRGVCIYALAPFSGRGIPQDATTLAMIRPAANLDRLTRYTGGLLIGGYESGLDPVSRLRDLAPRLRAGYTLTFEVPADGRRHRLTVQLGRTDARVRAPMAFRAPAVASH